MKIQKKNNDSSLYSYNWTQHGMSRLCLGVGAAALYPEVECSILCCGGGTITIIKN